jgi:hypothetical protein
MKATIQETDLYGDKWKIYITLTPETLEEAAILLRLAARRKKTVPYLRTGFCEEIQTDIDFEMNRAKNTRDTGIS